MTSLVFRSSAVTHPGARRTENEDVYVDRPDLGLWAVADGAGGHEAGALASRMIAETLNTLPPGLDAPATLAEVRARIEDVHKALLEEANRRGPETVIASTVVILMIRNNHFACLWAGDSRAYRWRAGVLERITTDHSLVQELVDAGKIALEEAESHPRSNVITRAVGAGEPGKLALAQTGDEVIAGDCFLLSSDGLTKELAETEIAALLGQPCDNNSQHLVAAALEKQARDNITAVLVNAAPC
jgi:serine/threonine protein phosphatase Stp1